MLVTGDEDNESVIGKGSQKGGGKGGKGGKDTKKKKKKCDMEELAAKKGIPEDAEACKELGMVMIALMDTKSTSMASRFHDLKSSKAKPPRALVNRIQGAIDMLECERKGLKNCVITMPNLKKFQNNIVSAAASYMEGMKQHKNINPCLSMEY